MAYLVVLAVAVLSPGSDVQSHLVLRLGQWLAGHGVPDGIARFDRLEVLANVAIVAPVGLLGAWAMPRVSWQAWTAYGFVGASTVEILQGLLLPARQASFSDIVANTAGALLGAVVGIWLRSLAHGRRDGPRDAPRSE